MRAGCVICGDLFLLSDDISSTPCGHTFHSVCIIQWIERSKSCPQCRHKATNKSLLKLYFDSGSCETGEVDPDSLQQQINNQKFQIRVKEQEINKLKESSSTLSNQNNSLRSGLKILEERFKEKDKTILAYKTQLQFMDRITEEARKTKEEVKNVRNQLKLLQNVEMVVNSHTDEVEEILSVYDNNPDSTRSIATLCSILKKELNKTIEDKTKVWDEAKACKKRLKEMRKNYDSAASSLNVMEQTCKNLEEDKHALEKENASLKKKLQALQDAVVSPSGDIKNSAINRLLLESPAPAMFKRSRREPQKEGSFVTPEVVRKIARAEEVLLSSDEESLCIDLTTPSTSKAQKANRRPLTDTINVGMSAASSQPHNIFAKNKGSPKKVDVQRSSIVVSISGDKVGYDGLGGHHKVLEFPTRNPAFKRKKRGIKITNRHGASSKVQSKTIKNYFHNTFDD